MLPLQRAWVLSLVKELRFHMLYGMAKKKKKKMKVVGGVLPLAAVANTFLIVGYPEWNGRNHKRLILKKNQKLLYKN